MNRQFLKEHWAIIRARLKQTYPHLTDNDLAYIAGQEEDVFSRVERRTGVKRPEIEHTLWQALHAA
jgi:hypothetical protein